MFNFIVNFEYISLFSSVSVGDFEHVNLIEEGTIALHRTKVSKAQ